MSIIFVIIQHSQKTDEIRTESLLAERFQKFSEGRTSGEAALTALLIFYYNRFE